MSHADNVGLPKRCLEDLNIAEAKTKSALAILKGLDEKGIRPCTEGEQCQSILDFIDHQRQLLYGMTPANSTGGTDAK